jgi:hypothetical protein
MLIMIRMTTRMQYIQLCFTSFQGDVECNDYITCASEVDEMGNIDPTSPELARPIQWVHDVDRKCIADDLVDHQAYCLNASWESTVKFVQSLLNT